MLALVANDGPVALLVDDEPVLLRMLGVNFHAAGFSVRTAATGTAALAAAAAEAPDVIVLDLGLPDVDGLDLVGRLRAVAGLARTPIVVLSGTDRDAVADRGYAADVQAHVTKPVEPAELIGTVRRAMARTDA